MTAKNNVERDMLGTWAERTTDLNLSD